MEASDHLEQYTALLRIRQKWARRNLFVLGALGVFGTAVMIVLSNQPGSSHPGSTLYPALAFVGAFVVVTGAAMEYRMLKNILELLSVLQRAMGKDSSSSQPPDTAT